MIEMFSKRSASIFADPGCLWRITIMFGCIATRFSAVSIRVSPFSTEDPDAEKFSVSAERRFSAISKETRVRVDASMKRLITSWPRSAGTFLTGRSLTSLKPSAVSRMRAISSGVRDSMPRRSLDLRAEDWVRIIERAESFLHDQHFVLAIRLGEFHFDDFFGVRRHGLADHVRVNRELAVTAVDEDCEHHLFRAAEVDERIERS